MISTWALSLITNTKHRAFTGQTFLGGVWMATFLAQSQNYTVSLFSLLTTTTISADLKHAGSLRPQLTFMQII
jgi:hypothetical protein